MKGNVVTIDSGRPERWTIFVDPKRGNSICCFYMENPQCWAGVVEVRSMDKLSELLKVAETTMRSARAQGRRLEVAV